MPKPKNGNNAQDRSEELLEYYNNLRTEEAKLDFLLSIEIQGMDEDLTLQERAVMSDELESFFNPVKLSDQPDANGEPQEVPDPETQERRLKAFALKYAQAKFQLGLEHKEIMNSLPADQKDREKAAGLLAQESESKKIFQSLHSMNMPLQVRHDKYPMMVAEAEQEFMASLTEEDKKIYDTGADLAKTEPRLLHHVHPEDVGLTQQDIDVKKEETERNLDIKKDRNWENDETMGKRHIFMDHQYAVPGNNYLSSYYLGLDKLEDKVDFIVDGSLESNTKVSFRPMKIKEGPLGGLIVSNEPEDADKELEFGGMSPKEKSQFQNCCTDFFRPRKDDGSFDHDEFEKRMDAVAEKIFNYDVAVGKFIENGDQQGKLSEPDDPVGKRVYVAEKICPEKIKGDALKAQLNKVINNGDIPEELITEYRDRKIRKMSNDHRNDIAPDSKNLLNIVNKKIDQFKRNAMPDDKKLYNVSRDKSFEPWTPSDDEKKVIDKRACEVKKKLDAEIRDNKKWAHPENNVSLDSMKKLDNLYHQFKGEDRSWYINSSKYNNLLGALDKVHKKYDELKDQNRELTKAEIHEIHGLYQDVASAASKYISDKERARSSSHGKNRFDIGFASLAVTNKGAAKEALRHHQKARSAAGSELISLKELEARAGRTKEQQKAYQKAKKRGGRANDAQRANNNAQNNNNNVL